MDEVDTEIISEATVFLDKEWDNSFLIQSLLEDVKSYAKEWDQCSDSKSFSQSRKRGKVEHTGLSLIASQNCTHILDTGQKSSNLSFHKDLSRWGLPQEIIAKYESKGVKTMFDWQVECLSNPKVLLEYGNLIYSAPTSAGKTLVAELLAIKNVLERQKKVIIILPFVSVVREKMFYFQDIFGSSGIRVEGFMGSHAPPGGFQNVHIAICTIEKANSLINRLMEEGNMSDLGAIIVDEIHLLGDPSRGYILELLLTKVKYLCARTDSMHIQIIGMSATLPNLDLLSKWLQAELFVTNFRPIPLDEFCLVNNKILDKNLTLVKEIQPNKEYQNDVLLQICLDTISENCSVLIFCSSKNWCESLAQSISSNFYKVGTGDTPSGNALRMQLNTERILEVLEQLKNCPIGLDSVLKKTISFGVAYHHAGLTFDERDIIEGAFKNGAIRVLVATSTLSSGVNLPARRVVIRSPVFQRQSINILTYKQMIGRAGRMGRDTKGESILMCSEAELKIASNLMTGELASVKSCLEGSDRFLRAILEVIASKAATSKDDLDTYTNCTLLYSQECDEDSKHCILTESLSKLIEYELVRIQNDGEVELYVATPLGKACLSSSMAPDDGLSLFCELQKAQRCIVLENDLHLIYLVTPYSVSNQWPNMDWMHLLNLWESLGRSLKRVGELVGIQESYMIQSIRGTVKSNSKNNKIQIHKRFYTALALQDLVNEIPLSVVASKFRCCRGMLQSLQQSAATFAGMVTAFCRQLGWKNMEILTSQFQDRLHFGIQSDLLELMKLNSLNGMRARSLFNVGFETVSLLASADVNAVESALLAAVPFQSEKCHEGDDLSDLVKRNAAKNIWITGNKGMTAKEAAHNLILEARAYIRLEMGVDDIKWGGKEEENNSNNNLNDIKSSLKAKETIDIPKIGVSKEKRDDFESDVSMKNNIENIKNNKHEKHKENNKYLEHVECKKNINYLENKEHTKHAEIKETMLPSENKEYNKLVGNKENNQHAEHNDNNKHAKTKENNKHVEIKKNNKHAKLTENSIHTEIKKNNKRVELKENSKHAEIEKNNKHAEQTKNNKHEEIKQNNKHSELTEKSKPAEIIESNKHAEIKEHTKYNNSVEKVNNDVILTEKLWDTLELNDLQDKSISLIRNSETSFSTPFTSPVNKSVQSEEKTKKNNKSKDSESPCLFEDSLSLNSQLSKLLTDKITNTNGTKATHLSIENASAFTSFDVEDEIKLHYDEDDSPRENESVEEIASSQDTNNFTTPNNSLHNLRKRKVFASPDESFVAKRKKREFWLSYKDKKVIRVPKNDRTKEELEYFVVKNEHIDRALSYISSLATASLFIELEEVINEKATIGSNIMQNEVKKNRKIDYKFSRNQYHSKIVKAFAFSFENVVLYFDYHTEVNVKSVQEKLQKLFNKVERIVLRGYKMNYLYMKSCGVDLTSRCFDVSIGNWIIETDSTRDCFDVLEASYIIYDLDEASLPYSTEPWKRRDTSCLRAWVYNKIASIQMDLIRSGFPNPESLLETEHNIARILADNEYNGIKVDKKLASQLIVDIKTCQSVLETKAFSIAGNRFSFNSSKAVAKILGLNGGRKTSTKKSILAAHNSPLASIIMYWRKLEAIKTKMLSPLNCCMQFKSTNERIHFNYSTETQTGRITIQEPNVQNVPRSFTIPAHFIDQAQPDTGDVIEFNCRNIFVASSGWSMVAADYCQLEMRILTHLCGDAKLVKIMNSDIDVFTSIAASWNSIPEESVNDDLRQRAKQLCYGIIYGIGAKSLSEQLDVTVLEASVFMDTFHMTYPGISVYKNKVIAECREKGYVETLKGRRRYLPNINSGKSAVRSAAERQALNTTIQGSAAEIAKQAMVDIDHYICKNNCQNNIRLLIQMHDELIYEVQENLKDEFVKVIKASMENSVTLTVPLPVKVKMGGRWGSMNEI